MQHFTREPIPPLTPVNITKKNHLFLAASSFGRVQGALLARAEVSKQVQSWCAVVLTPRLTWCEVPRLSRAGGAALELAPVHACVMAVIRERDTVPH